MISSSCVPARYLLGLIFSAFYLAPALLYLANANEVTVSLGYVISRSMVPQAALFVAGMAVCSAVGKRSRDRVVTFCASLTFLIYLQGNLLVWDYGRFDGTDIAWSDYSALGWLELLIWICVLVSSQLFVGRARRWAPMIMLAAIGLQTVAIGAQLLGGRSLEHPQPTQIDTDIHRFSPEQNVLFLVLDGLQSHALDSMLKDDESLREKLKGFVYFKDTLSVFPTTYMSIPAMLSGEVYRNDVSIDDFLQTALSELSLPDALARQGFVSSVVTRAQYCQYFSHASCTGQLDISGESPQSRRTRDALKIWDVTLFRHGPDVVKQWVYQDHSWLLARTFSRLDRDSAPYLHGLVEGRETVWVTERQQASGHLWKRLLGSADASSPSSTFKFLHFWSSHTPYVLGSSCELLDEATYRRIDVRQRFLSQGRCALSAALDLVGALRGLGVLEQTLVVIAADHGSPLPLVTLPGLESFEVNRAFPMLLIKDFGAQAPFEISDRPASLRDIPKTLANRMGLNQAFRGEDLFGPVQTRDRSYYQYVWEHRFWKADFLPPLQTYTIDGSGRDAHAWQKGGVLEPGRR